MTLYESVFIARQDVSATQVDGLTDSFEKIIVDNGGSEKTNEAKLKNKTTLLSICCYHRCSYFIK